MNTLIGVLLLPYVAVLVLVAALLAACVGPAIPRAIASFHHGERR